MRPRLPREGAVRPYLERMDASGTYSNRGPLVRELEARYADYLGVSASCVVATANATSGLSGATATAGRRRWLVPDFAFPSPALAVLASGSRLSLHDVCADDWQLEVPRDSTDAGTGLLPVVPFGAPVTLGRWPEAMDVVVDAAGSLGCAEGSLHALPPTWAVVYSLHATKVLPSGEGGIAVLGDPSWAEGLRAWINFGFRDSRSSVLKGVNAKMPETSAAYALASLDMWPEEREEWIAAQECVSAALSDVAGVTERPGGTTASPFFVVRFDTPSACTDAERRLADSGIESRRWWGSLHTMPAFAECERGDIRHATMLAACTLGLPMFRGLGNREADRVRSALEGSAGR